jgi:hypothetical protein
VPTRFRFFTRRMFGVVVEGWVETVGRRWVTVTASHGVVTWRERVALGTEVFTCERAVPFTLVK